MQRQQVKWVSISSCFSGLPIHFFSDPLIVEGHTVQFESQKNNRNEEIQLNVGGLSWDSNNSFND